MNQKLNFLGFIADAAVVSYKSVAKEADHPLGVVFNFPVVSNLNGIEGVPAHAVYTVPVTDADKDKKFEPSYGKDLTADVKDDPEYVRDTSLKAVHKANASVIDYVIQEDVHNCTTPRIIDIAYTAFTLAKSANDEDGGPTDWFTDTRPAVLKAIKRLADALLKEREELIAYYEGREAAATGCVGSAMEFALSGDDGMEWLRLWNEGCFDECREHWPEAPEACYPKGA